MHLNVDTSWYLRYRSSGNPDFGDTFGQVVNIVDRPSIPVKNQSLYTPNQIQSKPQRFWATGAWLVGKG